ncbi:hypothetical protein GCM10010922_28120 [Microbacterium sorbitolivorans]|nr:hypothetical protein GCM10010922_28120 [Microbacterium sorbitolivorans]
MTVRVLDRYSKPRGPGDQTSGGRGKLLRGTTGLSRVELLVRETLQNSWDARTDIWLPAYGARVYKMDAEVKSTLRDEVFADLPRSLSILAESLDAENTHAIEVFDRGTTGLDGPYHASETPGEWEPNNFNSFVFDIGTTKASAGAGGTYGFGKTATFEVSRAHTVVYWTRCTGREGLPEYRLIATSLHDPYAEGGARYTGAHWWGDASGDSIAPIRGEAARVLGEKIFRTHFGDDDEDPEMGTSILIIDPVITVHSEDERTVDKLTPVRSTEVASLLVGQIRDAMAHSVWPKTFAQDQENAPMHIELYHDRQEQPVAEEVRRRYSTFADALIEVRKEQKTQVDDYAPAPSPLILKRETFPITLRPRGWTDPRNEVFGGRNDNVVGHLHMIASAKSPASQDYTIPDDRLCLMRSGAELVVQYMEIPGFEDDVVQWHGVFKPTPECDDHFSATEPPTHDSWTPQNAEKEVSKYVVEKALGQIRQKARKFLTESQLARPVEKRSVRAVAQALRSFVPVGAAPDEPLESPRRRARSGATRRHTVRTDVSISEARSLPDGKGQQVTVVATTDSPDATEIKVTATVYAVAQDGNLALGEDELQIDWALPGGSRELGPEVTVRPGQAVGVLFVTQVATALEIDLSAEVVK